LLAQADIFYFSDPGRQRNLTCFPFAFNSPPPTTHCVPFPRLLAALAFVALFLFRPFFFVNTGFHKFPGFPDAVSSKDFLLPSPSRVNRSTLLFPFGWFFFAAVLPRFPSRRNGNCLSLCPCQDGFRSFLATKLTSNCLKPFGLYPQSL